MTPLKSSTDGEEETADLENQCSSSEGQQWLQQTNKKTDAAVAYTNTDSTNAVAKRRVLFTALIMLVGACASTAFLSLGLVSSKREENNRFERRATDITKSIESAWAQYELYGLWIQESCFSPTIENNSSVTGRLGMCSRRKFSTLVENVNSIGLEVQAVGIIPNVSHAMRSDLEAEAQQFYADNHPDFEYTGITGFAPNNETGGLDIVYESEKPFYWPVHFVLPFEGNEAAIELDLYSHSVRRLSIERATSTWKPVVTGRIRLAQETKSDSYSVLAYHPGIPLKEYPAERPTVFSSLAIRIPALIAKASEDASVSLSVHVFDSTDESEPPVFMAGADIYVGNDDSDVKLVYREETDLDSVQQSATRLEEREIQVADRTWVIVITSLPGTFDPPLVFVILGGTIIAVSSIILALWFYTSMGRVSTMQRMKVRAEAEKSAIRLENAQTQAAVERQLNEYIAHEVRNPLCSAITALSFVSAATKEPDQDEQTKKQMHKDVAIIDASLQFINELLRSLLDMHRAADKQMKISKAPTDILRDVLEPVAAILHLRGSSVKVVIDSPENLIVNTDRMRLKQISLNLATNASKFVEQGYIRLRAEVVDNNVRMCFEDSGSGIPVEKRGRLFAKFQESLDLLNQGTGIGLCLCKHLAELLGGDLWLDESFESGIEGCQGTKFVLDLASPPMDFEASNDDNDNERNWMSTVREYGKKDSQDMEEQALIAPSLGNQQNGRLSQLPGKLKVLFVDDEIVIRKLFTRAITRVAPDWEVSEASNGETALHLCKTEQYDLIFIDQYMASVEKQLLGTEAVRALRAQGIKATICGLSANDMETRFRDAGADSFLFKPFPCEKEAMKQEFIRILNDGTRIPRVD